MSKDDTLRVFTNGERVFVCEKIDSEFFKDFINYDTIKAKPGDYWHIEYRIDEGPWASVIDNKYVDVREGIARLLGVDLNSLDEKGFIELPYKEEYGKPGDYDFEVRGVRCCGRYYSCICNDYNLLAKEDVLENKLETDNVEYLIGYVYNNGYHNGGIEFEGTPENIASFIMNNQFCDKIMITDLLDLPKVTTFGGFLDRVDDSKLLTEIKEYLVPMQMGEKEPNDCGKPESKEIDPKGYLDKGGKTTSKPEDLIKSEDKEKE